MEEMKKLAITVIFIGILFFFFSLYTALSNSAKDNVSYNENPEKYCIERYSLQPQRFIKGRCLKYFTLTQTNE